MSVKQIHELRKRSNKYVADLSLHIAKVVDGNQQLINLNRDQLSSHKLSTGATITPSYSPSYAAFKGFSEPDLKLTGSFHREMFIKVSDDKYNIGSADSKTLKLLAKYSNDIFGIAESNKNKAYSITIPAMRKSYQTNVLR